MGKDIYQLKISLNDSKPHVWRVIQVPANYTFFDLQVAIQDAMGWTDSHLHQFFTASPYSRRSDYEIISYPYPDSDLDPEILDERHIKLYEWFKQPKDKMRFEYDFGDGWVHEILLQKVLPRDPKVEYPILIKGANACPPEDCGGVWGYQDLIKTLADTKSPEHEDMLEWLGLDKGSDFDPTDFDKEVVEFRDPKEVLQLYDRNF